MSTLNGRGNHRQGAKGAEEEEKKDFEFWMMDDG